MDYDLAIVGGGIAGSSLAIALAGRGARILIVEREAQFRDRVRGEGMLPWGRRRGAGTRHLSVVNRGLRASSALVEDARRSRDLIETTPSRSAV